MVSLSPSAVRRKPLPVLLVVVVLLALGAARYFLGSDEPVAAPPLPVAEGEYQVQKVFDGDTFRLVDDRKVRLIGIDCPEMFTEHGPERRRDYTQTEPWATEATKFTKKFIGESGVDLQFDRERLDKYERVLAYVYKDGKCLNEELVRAGLARAQLQYNYSDSYKRRFRNAQNEAKEAKLGIWSDRR